MSYHIEKQNALEFLERVKDIIESCSILRDKDDETIGYDIFEEGCVNDVIFCFNAVDLQDLTENWIISDEVYEKLLSFGDRVRWMENNNMKNWTVEAVKTDTEWTDIIEFANEIKSLLAIND